MTGPTETVPFLDVGAGYRELRTEIDCAIATVLQSGTYVLGSRVELFEEDFARYCGARHCVGVGNGLDALRLTLLAAGVGPGDEVIVPSNTFIATWLAVTQTGATVVPCEPSEHDLNINPAAVEAAIGPRTAAIVPVHLYGMPVDMLSLRALARRHGLLLVDDAAQAHGAMYRGKKVGSLADATAWSFYPSKNLGAIGDGGAITTDDGALAERLRTLRNYGSRTRYTNEALGWNSRLDPIQAGVLSVKLSRLDEWNARRRRVGELYLKELSCCAAIRLPVLVDSDRVSSLHLFVIRVHDRDCVQRALTAAGLQTLVHYPVAPHRQPAYSYLGLPMGALPLSEKLQSEVLSLPMGPHLPLGQAQRVVDALHDCFRQPDAESV